MLTFRFPIYQEELATEMTVSAVVANMSLSITPSYDLTKERDMYMFHNFGVVAKLTQFTTLGLFHHLLFGTYNFVYL
jgi:hypothetical protein